MKRWCRFFAIMFAFCASLFSVGNASWVINNTNTNNTVQAGSPDCTVSFYDVVDKPVITDISGYPQTIEYKDQYTSSLGTSSKYNEAETAYKTYYDIFKQNIGSTDKGYSSAGTAVTKTFSIQNSDNSIDYLVYSFTILQKWLYSRKMGFISVAYHYYSVVGSINKYNEKSVTTISTTPAYTTKAKKNSTISKPQLTYTDAKGEDYVLSGFFTDSSLTEPYDFSSPITSNMNLYVRWLKKTDSSLGGLANFISGIGTNSTGNIYNGDSAGYNIANDTSYIASTKTIYLDTCTIKSGANVNFDMNNGDTDNNARDGDTINETISGTNSLTLQQSDLDYEVILLGDLTINGTLTIGGRTGANGQDINGLIIGNYVQVDLNGHNITINNGGTLYSFGNIKDSKGDGQLTVKVGGTLKTQLVLYGVKSGNSVIWGYSKGISPFENYCLPYLPQNTIIEASSTSSGNLVVFTRMDLGRLGVFNVYIPFIGNDSTYFLQAKGNKASQQSQILLHKTTDNSLKDKNNASINSYHLYERMNMDFNNVSLTTNYISIKARIYISSIQAGLVIELSENFDLYLDRITFPMSSSFSLYFHASIWTIGQPIMINPGCTITADSTTEIIFDFYKVSGVAAEKSYPQIKITKLTISKTVPGSSHYISGGLIAVDTPICKHSTGNTNFNLANYHGSGGFMGLNTSAFNLYWDSYQKATVSIYGTVRFKTGNNSSAPYILSGNININKWAIDSNTPSKWEINNLKNLSGKNTYVQTHSLTVEDAYYDWFETTDDLMDSSNSMSYCDASRWVSMYLTSNGVSYEVDTNKNNYYSGTSKRQGGVFTDTNGNTYVLKTSLNYLIGNYDTQIDYSQEFTSCTVSSNQSYFTIGDTKYIYYGGLTLPITDETSLTASSPSVTCNANKFSTKTAYTASTFSWKTTNGGYWTCTKWA